METLTFDVDSAGTTPRTIFWFRFPVGCKIVGCTVDGEPVDYDFDPDTFTVTIKS